MPVVGMVTVIGALAGRRFVPVVSVAAGGGVGGSRGGRGGEVMMMVMVVVVMSVDVGDLTNALSTCIPTLYWCLSRMDAGGLIIFENI